MTIYPPRSRNKWPRRDQSLLGAYYTSTITITLHGNYHHTSVEKETAMEKEINQTGPRRICRGEVYYLPCPYIGINGGETKTRPCVVVSAPWLCATCGDILVVPLTHKCTPNLPINVRVKTNSQAPSYAKCNNIYRFPREVVEAANCWGMISADDLAGIDRGLEAAFGLRDGEAGSAPASLTHGPNNGPPMVGKATGILLHDDVVVTVIALRDVPINIL